MAMANEKQWAWIDKREPLLDELITERSTGGRYRLDMYDYLYSQLRIEVLDTELIKELLK